MLPCGKQRVYLTDEQIVEIICAMGAEDARWYLSQFVRLYKSEGQQIHLKIGDEEFEMKGIRPYPEEKELYLPSDTPIGHRQFCYLLSFIFEKDARWEEVQPEYFGKKTLVKFILLVDWPCNNGPYSKEVLQKLRYPLEDSPSNDWKKRKTFEWEESIEIMPNVKSKLQKIIKNFSNARNQGFARRATPDFFMSAAKERTKTRPVDFSRFRPVPVPVCFCQAAILVYSSKRDRRQRTPSKYSFACWIFSKSR